jgi:hypothetical protein
MATPNRWAIREAGEATFYSLVDGHAIVTLTTLKTSGVETTGETVYARGGRGNAKLVGFSSNREARLTLQDAIFDNEAVAMLTGNDLITGTKIIDRHEVQSVISNKITLDKTPQGAIISVYKVNPDGTNGEEYVLGNPATDPKAYSVSGKQLTFHTGVANGTQFRVYYQVQTAADAKTVKVTSDMFGGTFKVVLDVLVVDEYTKKAYQGQLIVPNAKFEDNFNLSFSADGDPAVLDLNMEILKSPTSTDMWELVIYDENDIV